MESRKLVHVLQIFGCLTQFVPCVYGTSSNDTSSQVFISSPPCFHYLHKKQVSCQQRKLDRVPDSLLNDIQTLDLSKNNIYTLHNHSFQRYNRLEQLELSENDINIIETATFSSLVRLRVLDLSGNRNLNVIPKDIFKESINLFMLNLSDCNLAVFHDNTIKWLPHLQTLSLSFNPITSINVTSCPNETLEGVYLIGTRFQIITNETFVFTCKCVKLYFQSDAIHTIDSRALVPLPLKMLWIQLPPSGVGLNFSLQVTTNLLDGIAQSAIESVTFYEVDCTIYSVLRTLTIKHLLNLILSHGKLKSCFGKSVNNKLPRLRKLKIYETDINIIYPEYFNGLTKLEVLDLSCNRIETIDTSGCSWHLNIQFLNLSGNLLRYLDVDAFQGLLNLTSLDLSSNRHLFGMFISCYNLKHLNVSDTALEQGRLYNMSHLTSFSFSNRIVPLIVSEQFLYWDSFIGTPSIERIVFRNSHFDLYEIWYKKTYNKYSLFHDLSNLTFLDLHGNHLLYLPSEIFPYLPSLFKLDLSQCQISNIESNALSGLESLLVLHLENNNILSLPPDFFNCTNQLRALYMDMNFLIYFHDNLFINTRNLSELTVSENKLLRVTKATFSPIQTSLKLIDLSSNPLECTCHLKWLVDWLGGSADVVQVHEVTCFPDLDVTLPRKILVLIHPFELCPPYFDSHCLIGSSIVIALLSITMALVRERTWLFRYKVFLLKLLVCGYNDISDTCNHQDFEFDLNIMFSNEDEAWAIEHLKSNLEEELPQFQRIAFGDDDLPLGMYYLDAVLYVIQNSFKTILLLSRAATVDNEFMMKLRTTLNHMSDKNMQRTILIFLEDIPDREMPYLVKLFLSEKGPKISWVHNDKDQKYFWMEFIKKVTEDVRLNNTMPTE